MKRRLLVTFGLLAIAFAAAQDTPSPVAPQPAVKREYPPIPANWPDKDYAEVRGYLYNPGDRDNLILQDGKLHPEIVNPEGIKLDAKQVERLLATIRGKSADGTGVGCFDPHHGFVFYDREGKPVADVTICFLCTIGVAQPGEYSMTTWDWDPLQRLVGDLGLPVFKTPMEADAHFMALARQWPDAKVKAVLDEYLLGDRTGFTMDDFSVMELLQGLGERTHSFLLAYLANKDLRARWLEKDPAEPFGRPRLLRLCSLFGDAPPADTIPLLTPFLDEANASIRCCVAETIAKTGAPGIVPIVRRALADSGKDVATGILPPPEEDAASADSGNSVAICALAGLQVAMDRGGLHADAKSQLFPDVKALDDDIDGIDWAKALIGLDSNRAVEFFLSPEIFKADSSRLAAILTTLCEMNLQIPRERILVLVTELRAAGLEDEQQRIMEPALLLLGRQRNSADLELLRGMGDAPLASCAMPGLLAWHGLEGYRERLSMLQEKKGFAALSGTQRLHVAADEFDSSVGLYHYFSDEKADHWRDAVAGLKAMKRDKVAAILEESAATFGEDGPSNDRETRAKQVDALEEASALDELDQRLKKEAEYWDLSLDRFAIEHAESFK